MHLTNFYIVDAKELCEITSDMSALSFKDLEKESTGGWIFSKTYYVATLKVRVIIGAADILFEVWDSKGKKKLSTDRSIQVEWGEGAEMSGPLGRRRVSGAPSNR